METALDTYGRLDIVVSNAGVVQFPSFAEYPDDEFERMVDIRLRGTWHAVASGGGGGALAWATTRAATPR